MFKKPCPILYLILLYKLSQDFLARQYIQVLGVPYSVSNKYTVFSTVCPGSSDPPEKNI